MRTRLWIGVAALALGAGAFHYWPRPEPAAGPRTAVVPADVPPCCVEVKPVPAETPAVPEVIETIVVERPTPTEPVAEAAQEPQTAPLLPPLVIAETPQPPRPEVATGPAPRMPYADEESRTPVVLTVAETREARGGLGTPEPADDAEEAEAPPETPEPPTSPVDYHRMHLHCPHSGCPYPHHMPRR